MLGQGKYLPFAFFLFFIVKALTTHALDIEFDKQNHLPSIPAEEMKKLEMFFHYLIHRSSIGYCLCGDKAIATESFIKLNKASKKNAILVPKLVFEYYGYSILWNGWKCWERYAHFFPSNKFVLRFIDSYDTLVLINKLACKKAVEDNLDLFQKYWKLVTLEEILEKICFPKNSEEYLFKNTAILGILYGFGRNNSIAFANAAYFQKMKPYTKNELLDRVVGYGFVTINNGENEEENKKAKKMFNRSRRNIIRNFDEKKCFETFLKLYLD